MTAWIIDDGPLDWLARAVAPRDTIGWPAGRYFVADATKTAAEHGAAQGNFAATKRRKLLGSSANAIGSFSIEIGSQGASILYEHLGRASDSPTDLAEHESIVWALTERTDAILVTVDKKAAMLALAELGCGRVAHAFDLWLDLRDNHLVTDNQFAKLCQDTLRSDQGIKSMPLRCA
jgi:hypothetical protein